MAGRSIPVFFALALLAGQASTTNSTDEASPTASPEEEGGFPAPAILTPENLEAPPLVGMPIAPIFPVNVLPTTPRPAIDVDGVYVPAEGPTQREKSEQMADCVINAIQAAQYIGAAALTIESTTHNCPSDQTKRNLCAADVTGVIGSFAAIASFLSSCAAGCSAISNARAGCAAAITGLVDSVMELVQAGNNLAENCVDRGAKAVADMDGVRRLRIRRQISDVDVAWCVIDVTSAASWLGKAGLQISVSAETCAVDKEICAANVMGVIGSFLSAASFLAPTATACAAGINAGSLCAADLIQLIGNLNNVAQGAIALKLSCAPEVINPGQALGTRRLVSRNTSAFPLGGAAASVFV